MSMRQPFIFKCMLMVFRPTTCFFSEVSMGGRLPLAGCLSFSSRLVV